MNDYYLELTSFSLPDTVISELTLNNVKTFKRRFTSDKYTLAKWYLDYYYKKSPYSNFSNLYGIFFQEVAKLDSYQLPEHLETIVLNEVSKVFDLRTVGNPYIRVQVIYGGSIAPLHIDNTRGASLVVPVKHGDSTTTFYTSTYTFNDPQSRGLLDPSDCTLVDSVKIIDHPVLLNADQIHAVLYKKGSATKQNPRISVTIKWEKSVYHELAQEYDQKFSR